MFLRIIFHIILRSLKLDIVLWKAAAAIVGQVLSNLMFTESSCKHQLLLFFLYRIRIIHMLLHKTVQPSSNFWSIGRTTPHYSVILIIIGSL